jgi:hypothetical protein
MHDRSRAPRRAVGQRRQHAAHRGGRQHAADSGECVRAKRGAGTRTRDTGVLLTGLRCSWGSSGWWRGDGRRLSSGGAARVWRRHGSGSELGFAVKRAARQGAAAFIGRGEGASACGPAGQGGAAREPESDPSPPRSMALGWGWHAGPARQRRRRWAGGGLRWAAC